VRQVVDKPFDTGVTAARSAAPGDRYTARSPYSEMQDEEAPQPRRVDGGPQTPGHVVPAPATSGHPGFPMAPGAAPPVEHDGGPVPIELNPKTHPPYVIEPPDVLLLDAVRLVPRPPYVVQPLDVLILRVTPTPADQPIDGLYTVTPDGFVNLGFMYGNFRVSGLTLERIEEGLRRGLSRKLNEPQISVGLASFRGVQQIRGEHLVRQDGTISLGTYGCLNVTGLTIAQARCAIERYLAQYLQDPEISVDVFGYNSKVYYVITDGAGYGQQIFRFPITGKEYVLDAITNIGGIPPVGSKKHIWVARPAPCNHECVQVLPVDWKAIVMAGSTCTNYQLFPGDRVYIKADPLITLDNTLAKIYSPIERTLGLALLFGSTIQTFRSNSNNNGNGNGSGVIIAR
jgi:polysaccharide export outer membrane protein